MRPAWVSPKVGCWGGPRVGDRGDGLGPTPQMGPPAAQPPLPSLSAHPQHSPRKEPETRGRQAGPGARGPPRGSLQSESSSSSEAEAPRDPCPEIQRLREAAGIALRQDKQPPAPRRCETNHKGERWGIRGGSPLFLGGVLVVPIFIPLPSAWLQGPVTSQRVTTSRSLSWRSPRARSQPQPRARWVFFGEGEMGTPSLG